MCRVLMYLGKPILIDELLYGPDNSLIKQSYAPRLMHHIQNLAGFGMTAWNKTSSNTKLPFLYKTQELPFFDKNLERLSLKIEANCLLAHIRGVEYEASEVVTQQNVHPFMFENCKLALAHNGSLAQIGDMKFDLLKYIDPNIAKKIQGTTDSEWIYAVLMSQFNDHCADVDVDEVCHAIIKTFEILHETRKKNNITVASPVNLFITNGEFLVTTRFVFDYGRFSKDVSKAFREYHSLWYTYGEEYGLFDGEYKMRGANKKHSLSFASEPLTQNTTSWIEIPEYSIAMAYYEADEIKVKTLDIDI